MGEEINCFSNKIVLYVKVWGRTDHGDANSLCLFCGELRSMHPFSSPRVGAGSTKARSRHHSSMHLLGPFDTLLKIPLIHSNLELVGFDVGSHVED